jgi:hypothetical protein
MSSCRPPSLPASGREGRSYHGLPVSGATSAPERRSFVLLVHLALRYGVERDTVGGYRCQGVPALTTKSGRRTDARARLVNL